MVYRRYTVALTCANINVGLRNASGRQARPCRATASYARSPKSSRPTYYALPAVSGLATSTYLPDAFIAVAHADPSVEFFGAGKCQPDLCAPTP